jgi:hypothetical protein
MRVQLAWLGTVFVIAGFLTPQAAAASQESADPIPAGVLASAREYVISKVGEAFFDSCLTWSPEASCFRPLQSPSDACRVNIPDWLRCPRYVVIYRLRIPERPFVDEVVVVNIKEDGGWFKDAAFDEGLPDCVSHPGECEFPIDREAATEIAKEAGLQPGITPWRADFLWSGRKYGTYVWQVENTLGDSHGDLAIIDANSGDVLCMTYWEIVVTP